MDSGLKGYSLDRNNLCNPNALSGLSPYLHFGQISSQRCAFEARKRRNSHPQELDAFLEELIVRRELADNYCFYEPCYDSIKGAWGWAQNTLIEHTTDNIFTRESLWSVSNTIVFVYLQLK